MSEKHDLKNENERNKNSYSKNQKISLLHRPIWKKMILGKDIIANNKRISRENLEYKL